MKLIIILLVIILLIFILSYYLFINKDAFNNTNFYILLDKPNDEIETINVIKTNSNTIIPLNVFITWSSHEMPPNMKKSINMVMSKNSEFNFYIYSDEDCRKFLQKYFIQEVVDAFDTLIPGAYKADLWRYCVLYKYGGIYQDIKFQPVEKFKYINLINKEYFVRDIKLSGEGIYNAFMVCKAGNDILYKCIKQILVNVEYKFYGKSTLEPTGPLLMKRFFSQYEINNLELYHKNIPINGIFKNNERILKFYDEYRTEQKKSSKPHYSILYKNREIYKQIHKT